ncbi:hypothetical protein GOB81_04460 [Acetobacter sp. LMG 1627]|uniref:Uncharacterized protein n=1 Tax=Acetobacter conturbans TaxID=1737472 RepID=A0ABX0JY14_9PROT|nr:hypothetical protein [Acetobacter conturbans]
MEGARLLKAVVAISCACTLAVLLVPDLLSGFLFLLQSVLEALFLPFRLLFDLALWLTTGRQIGDAVAGVGHAVGARPFSHTVIFRYAPAFLAVCGLLSFIAAVDGRTKSFLWLSFALHGIAGVVIGLPMASCLFPALISELVAVRRFSVITADDTQV